MLWWIVEKTVVKVLKLIETLAGADQPLGVTSLAAELGFTKSNAHRLLNTLSKLGYVRHHEDVGQYELTPKLWRVGVAVMSRMDLSRIAVPYMRALERETGESVNLAIFDDGSVVYVAAVQGSNPVRAFIRVGDRRPSYCTATGKVLLSHQPEHLLSKYCGKFKRYTPRTITSLQKLKTELALVRKQDYSVTSGEWRENVGGVAAPIRSETGEVIAAVGLMSPLERLNDARSRSHAARAILACAARISSDLGYSAETAVAHGR
jgi:IclR family KDG regulon transcriptional repressor